MPLVRCSQEFHKWVMEKASDGNPVSVVLDRMMAREEREPDEKPDEERLKKIDELDEVMEAVVEALKGHKLKLEKLERRVKKLEEEEEGEEEEEKLEEVKSELDQVDQDSFICDCGEKIEKVEDNIETAFWSGEEYLRCQKCGSLRNLKYLGK